MGHGHGYGHDEYDHDDVGDPGGAPRPGHRRRGGRGGRGSEGPGAGFGPGNGRGFGPGTGRGGPGGPGARHGGPGFGPGFGPGGGPGPFGRRRGRGRGRGDVRAAILVLLAEQPRHGYELIQEIAARSDGFWTPSPGSVYPTLQALEDEGLVTIASVEGRRTASLTDDGRQYVTENAERLGEPWAAQSDHGPALTLRREIMAARDAVAQVARVGSPDQLRAAAAVLAATRRELYRILADDPATEPRDGRDPAEGDADGPAGD